MNKMFFMSAVLSLLPFAAVSSQPSSSPAVRIFRTPSHTRANAGLTVRYAIERASWITHPQAQDKGAGVFLKFRRRFKVDSAAACEIDVSGDGRFFLLFDGRHIANGPHRGLIDNWQFQSYRLELSPGEHVIEAVVWSGGQKAPRAQLELSPAFILKADGDFDAVLSTGTAPWEVALLGRTRFTRQGWSGAFGTGWETEVSGTGLFDDEGTAWQKAETSVGPQGETVAGGVRRPGRLLYPSQLPDQMSEERRPGKVVDGGSLAGTFPANTKRRILWDLGDYYCGYPVLKASGGRGARIRWGWAESLRGKDGLKSNRNEWVGKSFNGFGDVFLCDGRTNALFVTPWMRCGRWCELLVETRDEPLSVDDVFFRESRYPLENEWSFSSSDASLDNVLAICRRGMENCTHEMLFDCPFYEQQMYPGDGRVELQVLESMTRDRRIVRRIIELFDFARRNDGFVPMNFPCWLQQESGTYTMCYAMMYGDLVDSGGCAHDWMSARLPGLRHTMGALQRLEDSRALPVNVPGWPFVDWVPEWNHGEAPDGRTADKANAIHSLLWVLAMQSAEKAERHLGDGLQADYWRSRAKRTFDSVRAVFWNEARGLFADDEAHLKWSEHAQALAILTGLLEPADERRVFDGLLTAEDLARTTVYFSHYLFSAYFRHGRGDLFLKKLDLWRDYVAQGLKTPLESPGAKARSDCHAWGAHPIYHALTGLAGIRPGASGYETVLVEPCPGGLSFIKATSPHPKGSVSVDLRFSGGDVAGSVTLPAGVRGVFRWKGEVRPLREGVNTIE